MNVLSYRMPFACLFLMILIYAYYKHRKELPSHMSIIFKLMFNCCFLHLGLEIATEYTVNNREIVPDALNYVLHVFFDLTVLWGAFLLELYIVSMIEINRNEKANVKKYVLYAAVILFSLLICVTPLSYVDTELGSYSQGVKAYCLYGGVLFFIVSMSLYFVKNKKYIPPEQYFGLRMTGISAFTLALVQIFFPYILLTGLTITIVTLVLYLALENPDNFYNGRINMFNENAFRRILRERMLIGKMSSIILVAMKPADGTERDIIRRQAEHFKKELSQKYNMDIFAITDKMYVFISAEFFKKAADISDIDLQAMNLFPEQITVVYEVVDLSAYRDDHDTLTDHIEDMKMHFLNEEIYIDAMTGVFNRNRYETDLASFKENETGFYVFFIDINGLKFVNDNLGHNIGDMLIIETARILVNAFTGLGQIYRMGGDEFTVLYFGSQPVTELVQLLLDEAERRSTDLDIPISFAVGYAFSETGRMIDSALKTADLNMYEDKQKSIYHR